MSVSSHQDDRGEVKSEQLATFHIGEDLFGIEVMKVQEVTSAPQVIPVPLAPEFVRGLVNLRGQISTAIGLRELFLMPALGQEVPPMSVVCRSEGDIISLLVDSIGEVVEVNHKQFERSPHTIAMELRRFVKGVYKLEAGLLSVLDTEIIFNQLSNINETASLRS